MRDVRGRCLVCSEFCGAGVESSIAAVSQQGGAWLQFRSKAMAGVHAGQFPSSPAQAGFWIAVHKSFNVSRGPGSQNKQFYIVSCEIKGKKKPSRMRATQQLSIFFSRQDLCFVVLFVNAIAKAVDIAGPKGTISVQLATAVS